MLSAYIEKQPFQFVKFKQSNTEVKSKFNKKKKKMKKLFETFI